MLEECIINYYFHGLSHKEKPQSLKATDLLSEILYPRSEGVFTGVLENLKCFGIGSITLVTFLDVICLYMCVI